MGFVCFAYFLKMLSEEKKQETDVVREILSASRATSVVTLVSLKQRFEDSSVRDERVTCCLLLRDDVQPEGACPTEGPASQCWKTPEQRLCGLIS